MDNQNGEYWDSFNNDHYNVNNDGYNNPRDIERGDGGGGHFGGGHFNASHRGRGSGRQTKAWTGNNNGFSVGHRAERRRDYGGGRGGANYMGREMTKQMNQRGKSRGRGETKSNRAAKNETRRQNDSFHKFRDPHNHQSLAHPQMQSRVNFFEYHTPEPLPFEAMPTNYTLDPGISTETRKLSECDSRISSVSTNPVAELEKTAKPVIPTTKVNVVKIKQEKDTPAKPVPKKLPESSEDESSSSDDSYEAGEVRTVGVPKTKTETNTIQPAKSKHSSSEEESSSDDSETPVKSKTDAKETSITKSRKLKKLPSEDDVVCMGSQERKYTIPDEDNEDSMDDESEAETKSKSKHKAADKCMICDKMGHTSYHCQMICKNCSAPHHSFKNCPQPPNLNIAVQTFMDFTMKQFSSFNVDPRFVLSTPTMLPAATPSKADKLKKEKRPLKKTKRKVNKKIKMESPNSDDDEDAVTSSGSESSEENSSEESTEKINKSMRKRIKKNSNLQKVPASTATPHFPFPMLAAPYNSLMYPYGAQFKFPN